MKKKIKLAGKTLLQATLTAGYFYFSMAFSYEAFNKTGIVMFGNIFLSAYFMLGFARNYKALVGSENEKK